MRKAENPDTAFRLAKQYHQEYPHCEELTLSLSYVLEAVTNNSSLSPEDHQKYQEQINTILTELTHSHRTSISNAASFLLANKYIRTGDLQQAQHILDQMPDPVDATQELTDKLFLQVTIYQQQGKFAEAAEKLEYALLNAATRIQTLLSLYTSLTMTAGETEIAKAIADKGTSFAQLFQLWEYNAHVNSYTVALKEKDTAAVLNLMRKLLNALCHPWATDETLLFSHVDWAISPGQQKDVLHNLLGNLSRDEEYAFLRGEPEFTALLEEFRP
jgi:thioredoxin-like negative regulator of GroEL